MGWAVPFPTYTNTCRHVSRHRARRAGSWLNLGPGMYVAPDWLHREAAFILDTWARETEANDYSSPRSFRQILLFIGLSVLVMAHVEAALRPALARRDEAVRCWFYL